MSTFDMQLPSEAAHWALAYAHRLELGARPVLADLDGTLCDPSHRRHHLASDPPDWVGFSLAAIRDPPLIGQINWLNASSVHRPVVIVSGRPSIAMDLTKAWLETNGVRWDAIALRPPGDRVPGIEHKMRVLLALRALRLGPEVALDDSPEVREAYEVEGVLCPVPSGTGPGR